MHHRVAPLLLLLFMATPAVGEPPGPGAARDDLQCGFTRKDAPDYVMWICNAAGTELSTDGVILWTRKSRAGADVVSTVWTGRIAELPKRAEGIIAEHRRYNAGCEHYIHVARATEGGADWNVAAQAARRAIQDLRGAHPGLCYAAHPATADYVLAWSDQARFMPSAFTLQVPRQLPARGRDRVPPSSPDFVSGNVRDVAIYRVVPGLDGTILRLGVTVYESGALPVPDDAAQTAAAFGKALASVMPAR